MFGFASVHYCQKPNVKVKFYILYFQWYMPIIVSYTASGELGKKYLPLAGVAQNIRQRL